MTDEEMYSRITQYYIEQVDNLRGLESEAEELLDDGEQVPESITREIHRHKMIVGLLINTGKEKFNKTPNQLYQDGWNFWFKEDAELREKRYGKK